MIVRFTVATALLFLTSCEKPLQCDARGKIIIPAGATVEQQLEYNRRNLDLTNRQADTRIGKDGGFTRDAMEKAEGCP